MRYLLMIYTEERAEAPTDNPSDELNEYNAFTEWTQAKGYFKGGEALQPTSTATTVRVRDGRTITTDGPFVETKEALGGYYLLECANLDEAIEAAARIPGARHGSIEVRPIWEYPMSENVEAVASAG